MPTAVVGGSKRPNHAKGKEAYLLGFAPQLSR
jgi:hypothetical protein